ncbi:MAG: zinc ribbon domain-containing protein [Thomasclavelia sp.]|jgi:ribosomal protein L40E|nr:zinc ribbon domain-containing protein [Thomasclavelia sp.]
MYCRKCGAKISDSAVFCESCGTEVIKVKQKNYDEKYKENKKKAKKDAEDTLAARRAKGKDEKNPYINAAIFATLIAFVLSVFPWNYIGTGIGTSLPMRIIVVAFALLADYHCTKAKQVNNLIYSKYGFRINGNVLTITNALAIFVTMIGLFALLTM